MERLFVEMEVLYFSKMAQHHRAMLQPAHLMQHGLTRKISNAGKVGLVLSQNLDNVEVRSLLLILACFYDRNKC